MSEMVRQLTVNLPEPLYERLEAIREEVHEVSTEDFILKLITGGLILIDRELQQRKLVVTPTLVGPDGGYIGKRSNLG